MVYSRGKLTFPRSLTHSSLTNTQVSRYSYLLVVTTYWSTKLMHPLFPDSQNYDTDAFEQLCSPQTPILPCFDRVPQSQLGSIVKEFS